MSIVAKLTNDRGLILERKNFVLLTDCKVKDCKERVIPLERLREGLQIPEETSLPKKILICHDGDCDIVENKTLSDYIKEAFDSVEETLSVLPECEIYYLYCPLYETEKEVFWLGVRYKAEETRIKTIKEK